MTDNKRPTRYYSDLQEKTVAKLLNGFQVSNSGAGRFNKGDVIQDEASILIECKTSVSDKTSFSVKKTWLDKNKEEAFSQRLSHNAIAFNFGPDQDNYFIIDSRMMQFLVEKLIEDSN